MPCACAAPSAPATRRASARPRGSRAVRARASRRGSSPSSHGDGEPRAAAARCRARRTARRSGGRSAREPRPPARSARGRAGVQKHLEAPRGRPSCGPSRDRPRPSHRRWRAARIAKQSADDGLRASRDPRKGGPRRSVAKASRAPSTPRRIFQSPRSGCSCAAAAPDGPSVLRARGLQVGRRAWAATQANGVVDLGRLSRRPDRSAARRRGPAVALEVRKAMGRPGSARAEVARELGAEAVAELEVEERAANEVGDRCRLGLARRAADNDLEAARPGGAGSPRARATAESSTKRTGGSIPMTRGQSSTRMDRNRLALSRGPRLPRGR